MGREDLINRKSGHAIILFSVKIGVGGVADKADQPLARAVPGKVRSGRILILFAKLMAVSTLHFLAKKRPALLNLCGLFLIGCELGLELCFGRKGRDNFA